MGGWWRKLNQPLISYIPKSMIYTTIMLKFLLLIFCVGIINYYYQEYIIIKESICVTDSVSGSVSEESFKKWCDARDIEEWKIQIVEKHIKQHTVENFRNLIRDEKKECVTGILPYILAVTVLLGYMLLELMLLFPENGPISRCRSVEWHRKNIIKNFTIAKPLSLFFGLLAISALMYPLTKKFYGMYSDVKKEEILISYMKNGNMGLDEEFLNYHDIPLRQFSFIKRQVTENGADYMQAVTTDLRLGFLRMFWLFSLLIGILFLKFLADSFFAFMACKERR